MYFIKLKKNSPSHVGALLILYYFYAVLIDCIIAYVTPYIDGSKARSIEAIRACEEDQGYQYAALKDGHLSLAYPDLFSSSPYKEWAEVYKIAPLGSIPRVNVYYCNEGYGIVKYTTDRLGFRNDDALYDVKNISGVLVGDSYAHGACVSNIDTISARLTSQGFQTLNLATGSNRPLHYAAIIKTFIPKFKPRYATIVFYPNDNLEESTNDPFYKYFFKGEQNYFGNSDLASNSLEPSDALKSLYLRVLERIQLFDDQKRKQEPVIKSDCINQQVKENKYDFRSRLRLSSTRALVGMFFSKKSPRQENLPFGSKLALDTLRDECLKFNCYPEVVYIPNSRFWRPDYRAERYKELLHNYCDEIGIAFIDTSDEINKLGSEAYALKGPHLSPRGYKIIADKLISRRMNDR